MFDHLDHWKTYPAKSSFTPSDAVGYKGEKVFEQPLIAAQPGEQSIPGLEFSYFNPNTRHYERAQTQPIKVTIAASLADGSLSALAATQSLNGTPTSGSARGLRPDHPRPQSLGERAETALLPGTVSGHSGNPCLDSGGQLARGAPQRRTRNLESSRACARAVGCGGAIR